MSALSDAPGGRGWLRRFRRERGGVAAIEFAAVAPLLVLMMLGSIGATRALWASGKLDQATSTIGDLISQENEMDDSKLLGLMKAAPLVMEPYAQNDLKLTVSSILACYATPDDPTSELRYFVTWSRSWKDGGLSAGHAMDARYPKEPDQLRARHGDTLIVTESVYTYAPKIAFQFDAEIGMGETAFHQPRESDRIPYVGLEDEPLKTCVDYMG